MKVLKFNINGKRILNTILVAFFTVTIYWVSVLVMPDSLFYVIANRFEPTFVLLGGINFIAYIIIKKGNRHKNMMLYYVSVMLWNMLATYVGRWDFGLLQAGVYIEFYSLITLGILFFIYFIILKYLDYKRKRDNYVQ